MNRQVIIMFQKCYPMYCVKSVYELDEAFYTSNGIKAVIFDIDNTLVTHDTPIPPQELMEYFAQLDRWGIKYAIASNNKRSRVELFCRNLGVPYYDRAAKPLKICLKRLLKKFGVDEKSVCLVGDQLFTDIFGANRMGFVSVLVTAVGEDETGFVSFKRVFERMLMKRYNKSRRG